MMNRSCAGFFADFFQYADAQGTVVTSYLNLDQFMRSKRKFNFFQHLFGQAIVANADNRIKMMTKATQVSDLFGVQDLYLVDSKRLAFYHTRDNGTSINAGPGCRMPVRDVSGRRHGYRAYKELLSAAQCSNAPQDEFIEMPS